MSEPTHNGTTIAQAKPELRDPHLTALLLYIANQNSETTDEAVLAQELASFADLARRILNAGPAVTAFAGRADRPSVADVIEMRRRSEERADGQPSTWDLIADDSDEDLPITIRPQEARDVLFSCIHDATITGATLMYELLYARRLNVSFEIRHDNEGGVL